MTIINKKTVENFQLKQTENLSEESFITLFAFNSDNGDNLRHFQEKKNG